MLCRSISNGMQLHQEREIKRGMDYSPEHHVSMQMLAILLMKLASVHWQYQIQCIQRAYAYMDDCTAFLSLSLSFLSLSISRYLCALRLSRQHSEAEKRTAAGTVRKQAKQCVLIALSSRLIFINLQVFCLQVVNRTGFSNVFCNLYKP